MNARTIRKKFLDYFESKEHQVVRSSSIVPADDPTLYFTNAGMVQFKNVFVGEESRSYSRACTSQKCLRVSGKHNDLENVGRTSRHHTFFEMLGNFSFGDYFKKEAIGFAWEFLTKTMGLDETRFVATVFAGEDGIPGDDEAFDIWHKEMGLPKERVQRLGKADNFWAMGDTGPCGPCSELHYHQSDEVPCNEDKCLGAACECDRWVEVWNLVFMQFNRDDKGAFHPLKAPGVDTGMGLERLAAVLQGQLSTYDTDLLMPIIHRVADLAGKRYGDNGEDDVSLRVVADHARATAFCIADGVFPEKGGREYVLRRIMRRAIRHGKLLGFEEPFFHLACEEVVNGMGDDYSELHEHAQVIQQIVQAEERAFRRTLSRGLLKLQQNVAEAGKAGKDNLEAGFVGDLYATDGFPVDLTRIIAEEAGLAVDEEAAMRWVAETHGAANSKIGDQAVEAIYRKLAEELDTTEFKGYEQDSCQGRVVALLSDGEEKKEVGAGQSVEVICDQTPFYGRAGGQVGDRGVVEWSGGRIDIVETTKPAGTLIVHAGKVAEGKITVGQSVELKVDSTRRDSIRRNHSATHLLHHALRAVLGDHVAQKGSEVSAEQLRFDFSHFQGMTSEEQTQVETMVNDAIRKNELTATEVKSYDEARSAGAMALFGEKYGESVRMVRVGSESVELCGGTHVSRTGDIGLFRFVSEDALALGVRRVACLTGDAALKYDQQTSQLLSQSSRALKTTGHELPTRIEKLLAQVKDQAKEIADLKQMIATGVQSQADQVQEVNGIKVLVKRVDAADPKVLRNAGDTLRNRIGNGVVVLAGAHQGKATLLVMVSKDLSKKTLHAGKMVARMAAAVGGKGGGRPDMAQAGGPNIAGIDNALKMVPDLVSEAAPKAGE